MRFYILYLFKYSFLAKFYYYLTLINKNIAPCGLYLRLHFYRINKKNR